MSLDKLQEKIRKSKNPTVLDFTVSAAQIPPHLLAEEGDLPSAYERFCRELLTGLRGVVPAVRLSYSYFAMLDRLALLPLLADHARALGYYVILDAPEALSPLAAELTAQKMLSLPADGVLTCAYIGSDGVKPYVNKLASCGKSLFVVIRTGNRSAAELQDLMTGSRLVHMAVADMVSRMGEPYPTRCGYQQVAGLAAASSASCLKTLREKYKNVFLLLDGYDYPHANAKYCSNAFDKLGHGAAACVGATITAAWQQEADPTDYVAYAVQAAERTKKNLTRYITIL